MNACMNPNTAAPDDHEIAEGIGHLAPTVSDLLYRITNREPVVTHENGIRMESPFSFPDGIGEGSVVAELFRYRDSIRLDVRIEHNRYFAGAEGAPTDRRCFLNDYIASVRMPEGTEAIPTDFVRSVVAGIAAARDAVRRHNKLSQAPWNEIRVAAATMAEEAVG